MLPGTDVEVRSGQGEISMKISIIRARFARSGAVVLTALAALASVAAHGQAGPAPAPTGLAPVKAMTLMSAVIPTTDLEKATAFYTLGLGMTAARGANPREVVLGFPNGGSSMMLLKNAVGPGAPHPGPSRVILQVPDMKALAARLQGAGYSLKGAIRDMAQYHILVAELEDPDGNSLELIQRGE
jgi:predicted enzyme related to lactoylglutathione lyase